MHRNGHYPNNVKAVNAGLEALRKSDGSCPSFITYHSNTGYGWAHRVPSGCLAVSSIPATKHNSGFFIKREDFMKIVLSK
jgi:hypothetical protein